MPDVVDAIAPDVVDTPVVVDVPIVVAVVALELDACEFAAVDLASYVPTELTVRTSISPLYPLTLKSD